MFERSLMGTGFLTKKGMLRKYHPRGITVSCQQYFCGLVVAHYADFIVFIVVHA